ncbi:hypothetical protein M885DRAFT_514647 [Pelagophyceae sp. CCMP2097]|nr:hypothetical protein M885DRAFT_514647 [Pelagophyceae sp. CCMP2097]
MSSHAPPPKFRRPRPKITTKIVAPSRLSESARVAPDADVEVGGDDDAADSDDAALARCCGCVVLDEAQAESGAAGVALAYIESTGAIVCASSLVLLDVVLAAIALAGGGGASGVWVGRAFTSFFACEVAAHLRATALVHSSRVFFADACNRLDVAALALDLLMVATAILFAPAGSAPRLVAAVGRTGRLARLLRRARRLAQLLRRARAVRGAREAAALLTAADVDPFEAAEAGDAARIRLVLEAPEDHVRDRLWATHASTGESVLYVAAKRGREGVIEVMCVEQCGAEFRAALEKRDAFEGFTPLFVAALHRHRAAAEALALLGADASAQPLAGDFVGVSAAEMMLRRGWRASLDRVEAAAEARRQRGRDAASDKVKRASQLAARATQAGRLQNEEGRMLARRRLTALRRRVACFEERARRGAWLRWLRATLTDDELLVSGTPAAQERMRLGRGGTPRPASSNVRRHAATKRRLKNLQRKPIFRDRPVSPWRRRPGTRERLVRKLLMYRAGTFPLQSVGRRCAVDLRVSQTRRQREDRAGDDTQADAADWPAKGRNPFPDGNTVTDIDAREIDFARSTYGVTFRDVVPGTPDLYRRQTGPPGGKPGEHKADVLVHDGDGWHILDYDAEANRAAPRPASGQSMRVSFGDRPTRPTTAEARPGTADSAAARAWRALPFFNSRPNTAHSRPTTAHSRPTTASNRPTTAGVRWADDVDRAA